MTADLDLVIALNPPPADAPPETLAQITLRYDAEGLQHSGNLLTDPLSEAERSELRWYLEDYWRWPFEQFQERGQAMEALLPELGRRLYAQVFSGDAARDILQAWRHADPGEGSRRISIVSSMPAALALPWELLHDTTGFLVLRTRQPVAIVRRVPRQEGSGQRLAFTPPLRILLVTARPEGAGFIDPRGIARPLYDAVEEQMAAGELVLEYLRPPTLPALVARLNDPQQPAVHILHFDGHGTFVADRQPAEVAADGVRLATGGSGALAFEDDAGNLALIPAGDLANILGSSGVKLALLTACKSAVSAADDAFSSVAGQLIKGGVDAVIAMSASLLVASATRYTGVFYRALARNIPVTTAHEQSRQQLYADPQRHVLQRTRDAPGKPVQLRDWWLPHFYQQRPLNFAPEATAQPVPLPVATCKLTGFPHPPRYGFGGRARELLTLERALLKGKLLVIHGFGGQGKTSLASEAADWLTRTGMYCGALFLSMEGSSGGAGWLLAELARHLGCYDGNFNPDDPPAALAQVRPRLREQPTLLVVDNLESILPRGDAPLAPAERTQLWDVLCALAGLPATSPPFTPSPVHPCGVVLTTRDTEFGDPRLQPGMQTAHLHLAGLSEADAYALASRLLEVHSIGRERAPYPELMQLLAQLDYHPLALEQVLPLLREEPLDRVLLDFSALLERCLDADVTGRNRSLLASLDYSLCRLTEAQRELLPRLALFEGGANEDDLLAITEIPESAWQDLRKGLEQAALISPERIGNYTAPFLRFHPVLAPALRRMPGADDPARQGRYATRYHAVANYLYREDTRNPLPVRALVQRELPNLRRAFDMLRARGDYAAAVDMADSIAWFLNYFSLGRELADLRRKQADVAKRIPQDDGALSQAEYLYADGQGKDAYNRRDLPAAYNQFSALLARIEAQPAGAPRGPGSYEQCVTLGRLARCLQFGGQPAAAEPQLRRALDVIDGLIAAQPDNPTRIRQRGALLTDLGDVLRDQGRYAGARAAYEDAEQIAKEQDDTRQQGVVLGQLGTLALRQRDYAEATRRYREALELFRRMGEPEMEAVAWHQLGIVAQEQAQSVARSGGAQHAAPLWAEAERCYRESLTLHERQGQAAKAAATCNQLAIVARGAGRPTEAAGWYQRAIAIAERINEDKNLAAMLNNLADLLLAEVRAGRMGRERLAEARGSAQRALAIKETLDLSTQPWTTLNILAEIAELEGALDHESREGPDHETREGSDHKTREGLDHESRERDESRERARAYRRRERETFAQFAGNRWHIDRQHGALIRAIAAVAQGAASQRATVEAEFPKMEAVDAWRNVPAAIRRLWDGERDWHALCEDVGAQHPSLLILRVLETLGEAVTG